MKNVLGHVAYLLEGAKRLYDIPSYPLKIKVNDDVLEGEFVYGMITNSISVGGMKNMIGKDIQLDDGLFEVTLIRMPQNPIQLNDILTTLLMPIDRKSRYIYTCKTSRIEITSEDYVPWTLDGEFGGNHKSVIIENLHQAVTLIVPQ
jgi:diacylglycerol kinase family enzyme